MTGSAQALAVEKAAARLEEEVEEEEGGRELAALLFPDL